MTEEILEIKEQVKIDESVESYQFIEKDIDQGITSLNNAGELTITFQNQDAWLLPSDSYLKIEGNITGHDDAALANNAAIAFVNNGIMQLFSTARYSLNNQIIEYFENAGITTTMHNYLTKSKNYQGDGWFWVPDRIAGTADVNNISWRYRKLLINKGVDGQNWNFSAMIPLNCIFNFCSDYKKVIYGMQHKISLTRTADTRALMRANAAIDASGHFAACVALANDAKVVLSALKWCMPYVQPSATKTIDLLDVINTKEPVPLVFLNKRSEVVAVPRATTFNWKLQLAGGIERPRFLIFGFQTDRGVNQTTNSVTFDRTPNVISGYVILNGIRYPYTDLGTDLASKKYTKFYRDYLRFYDRYNGSNVGDACLSGLDFVNVAPLYVFDVSHQPEKLKNTTIDVTLNMTFAAAAAANTLAYCLMYFDSVYTLTGDSTKQIIQQLNYDK